MVPKRALVISGGGAKGAFAAGAIAELDSAGIGFSVIAGASAGALNAALLAQGSAQQLPGLWQSTRAKDVYRGSFNPFWLIKRLWNRRLSVFDTTPLRRLLASHISLDKLQDGRAPILSMGTVHWRDGEYEARTQWDFMEQDQLISWLMASAAIPLAFPPQPIGNEYWLDGGVRNNNPLGDILWAKPREVWVINANPPTMKEAKPPRSMKQVGARALELLMHEALLSDQREFIRMNSLVAQAAAHGCNLIDQDGEPYRVYRLKVLNPSISMGETLDFSKEWADRRIDHGRAVARKAIDDYTGSS